MLAAMSHVRAVVMVVLTCAALNVWLAFPALTRTHRLAPAICVAYLLVTAAVLVGFAIGARRRFALREAASRHMTLQCAECGSSVIYHDSPRGTFERALLPLVTLQPYSCLDCGFRAYVRRVPDWRNSAA